MQNIAINLIPASGKSDFIGSVKGKVAENIIFVKNKLVGWIKANWPNPPTDFGIALHDFPLAFHFSEWYILYRGL